MLRVLWEAWGWAASESSIDAMRIKRDLGDALMARPLTIQDMHRLAAARGGAFTSPEYVATRVKHGWMCAKGHPWDALPSSIRWLSGPCWCLRG